MDLFQRIYTRYPKMVVQVSSQVTTVAIVFILLISGVWLFDRAYAADDEPEVCPIVGKAGSTILYRCEDWEMAKVCYLNNFGFVFCLED